MSSNRKIALMVAGFLLSTPAVVYCQKNYSLKSHTISVDGTSTIHDWSSAVTKPEWTGQITTEGNAVKAFQNVTLTIPVTSIKSEKGGVMDDKTYEAFNHEKNPNITFKLTKATITGTTVKANGTLTMAGVTKTIVVTATTKVNADGSVHLSGSHKLNMKDYKMTPPKAVMGTIKVGEKVTLLFELTLTSQ